MKYINKNFFIENVKVRNLAKKFRTPIYCYSQKRLKENINNFKKNFKSLKPIICFAVKANANLKLLKEIKKFGLGADVVSIGELTKALKAGIQPKKIVFSGVGKTSEELNFAIDKKILLINAESKSEILEIKKIAKKKKKAVSIGIRLNPNTDAKTLSQISTGKKQDKFGVSEKNFLEMVKDFKNSKFIKLKCISVHIGSQILNHHPYEKMLKVVDRVIKKTNYKFQFIDLGGGMGISYGKKVKNLNYKRYATAIKKVLKRHKAKIIFEPGRSIIGSTGILVSKVIYIKQGTNKNFVILDAAMNDLMRPALYGAEHLIIPESKNNLLTKKTYEFVGPICESTDKFLTTKKFQKLYEKDLVMISDVGAYGMSLSSNYNERLKPIEILINKSKINIIKKRQKLKDLI
jgi:diaminopimelate decarboxylase